MSQYIQQGRVLRISSLGLKEKFNTSVPVIPFSNHVLCLVQDGSNNRALLFLQTYNQGLGLNTDLVFTAFARAADNKGGPGLINQYAVYLIHNRVIESPLYKFVDTVLHIISQVVKPEFVVSPVSYIAFVCLFPFRVIHPVDNYAH